MEIVFSEHAVIRMLERSITPDMVRAIIRSPMGKIRQSRDKWIFYKSFAVRRDNHVAAVVVERVGERFEVITVMIDFEVHNK